jgi:UDP-4-amino-4,6-dideoxy-N-acetyl-beta-L-altrosamine transaminase
MSRSQQSRRPIPYGRQYIDESDVESVIATLRSDFITQGPAIPGFEQKMAEFVGARFAVAVSSATAALHLGALALDLGPGDLLWTCPNTFVSSANCARFTGADVDFVDLDPRTYNVSVNALKAKLESSTRKPKVLVPVHFSGQPCEMAAIRQLCNQHGIKVMEDASHAVGAEFQGMRIGASQHSELTVFSFHPVKILTTGEGGMIVTNDAKLFQKLVRLRSHGITRDPEYMEDPPEDPWYYQQIELGYNYRITDIQAALGCTQLEKLPHFLQRRRQLAARYNKKLSKLPLILPWQHPDTLSSWHLYVVQVDETRTELSRRQVFDALRDRGVLPQIHYIPVHLQPYYRRLGFEEGDYPNAEAYYDRALSLPMFFSLTDAEQDHVVKSIEEIFQA